MFTRSIWNAFGAKTDFPSLQHDVKVDTAIIGGGITGVTTAGLLAEKGRKAIVLEALKVGGGTSSHSTGNLYVTIDQVLSSLKSKYDMDTIRQLLKARGQALAMIKNLAGRHQLDCDFEEQAWHLYSAGFSSDKKVEKELKTALKAGLDMTEALAEDIPFRFSKGIKLSGQAQFNPMRYVQTLANAIHSDSCAIHECTRVQEVKKDGEQYILRTDRARVTANNVVHATHTPKGVMFLQTLLGPYREYGIACRLNEPFLQRGIFWGYHEGEKYSTRIYERDGQQFLMVIGQAHKVGQAKDNTEKIKMLEAFAHQYFQVGQVVYRWGGQHYRPADLLPYIGRLEDGLYVATGYSTDGLVYGTLAGMMISDAIAARQNEFTELFDPTRHQPLKAARNFVKENLNVAKQYLKDLPGVADDETFRNIAVGEGKVIEMKGHKLAVHRDQHKKLHILSAVCPHMACIVSWNNAEKTWDCPCHGSRFQAEGTLLEGPAYNPLHTVRFKGDEIKVEHGH